MNDHKSQWQKIGTKFQNFEISNIDKRTFFWGNGKKNAPCWKGPFFSRRCVFTKSFKKKRTFFRKKRTFFLGKYHCKFEKGAFFFEKGAFFFNIWWKKLSIFEIISPDLLVLDNFSLKYWKKTHLFQKKTHLFQIYNRISLKKRCVFFWKRCVFFLKILEKRTFWKKKRTFFSIY